MPMIKTPGRHEVTATKAALGESVKGTPFIQIQYTDDNGDTITGWSYLSEKAFETTLDSLRQAFGFNGDFENIVPQVEGKLCSITTEFEVDDKGVEKLRVKWLNPLGGGMPAAKPIAGGSSFLKGLTQKASRIPVKAAAPVARPPRAAQPAPAGDSDFPA